MSDAIAEPLLIDLPEQIETERLILRPPRIGEGAIVNGAIHESLAELAPWMPWATPAPTAEQTEANLRSAIAQTLMRQDIRIHLHLKRDGSFVGGSGFHRVNWSVPRVEIGYWVRTTLAGQGYVTEAVVALARFALDTLKVSRVEIRTDERNDRSRRVAERAGFELEGILRNEAREHGQLRNTAVYALLPLAGEMVG